MMSKHRNPRRKVPKRLVPDNFTLGLRIRRIYEALVELEALAITADEAVMRTHTALKWSHD
jgi:hypothetical protein